MWIKWKYNNHDFKEADIPDDLPMWRERLMVGRIKWKKINRPSKTTLSNLIENHRGSIKHHQQKLAEYKSLLKGL